MGEFLATLEPGSRAQNMLFLYVVQLLSSLNGGPSGFFSMSHLILRWSCGNTIRSILYWLKENGSALGGSTCRMTDEALIGCVLCGLKVLDSICFEFNRKTAPKRS